MMKENFLSIIIISTILFFSSVYCNTGDACTNRTNTDCSTCIKAGNCAFCKNNKQCVAYDPLSPPCGTSDMQYQTCVGNFRVWIIIVAVLVGILLIAIFIVVCCICRKCKRRTIRREERRQEADDQRMEERRAAAEVRSTERNRVADQIRMKYGILKEKDNATDYTRMS